VQLGERVDELEPDPAALVRAVQRRGDLGGDDLAVHRVHEEERRPDDPRVLADGQHPGRPHGRRAHGGEHPRLAQDVVGRRGDRAARGPAQDEARVTRETT
jgi:hypothetical protein